MLALIVELTMLTIVMSVVSTVMDVAFGLIGWAIGTAFIDLIVSTFPIETVSILGWAAAIGALCGYTTSDYQLLLFILFVMWNLIDDTSPALAL
tara:strand:+ start:267 stop:548 length:282 start_codon:yes stop_codon:yes gene_type:complete